MVQGRFCRQLLLSLTTEPNNLRRQGLVQLPVAAAWQPIGGPGAIGRSRAKRGKVMTSVDMIHTWRRFPGAAAHEPACEEGLCGSAHRECTWGRLWPETCGNVGCCESRHRWRHAPGAIWHTVGHPIVPRVLKSVRRTIGAGAISPRETMVLRSAADPAHLDFPWQGNSRTIYGAYRRTADDQIATLEGGRCADGAVARRDAGPRGLSAPTIFSSLVRARSPSAPARTNAGNRHVTRCTAPGGFREAGRPSKGQAAFYTADVVEPGEVLVVRQKGVRALVAP